MKSWNILLLDRSLLGWLRGTIIFGHRVARAFSWNRDNRSHVFDHIANIVSESNLRLLVNFFIFWWWLYCLVRQRVYYWVNFFFNHIFELQQKWRIHLGFCNLWWWWCCDLILSSLLPRFFGVGRLRNSALRHFTFGIFIGWVLFFLHYILEMGILSGICNLHVYSWRWNILDELVDLIIFLLIGKLKICAFQFRREDRGFQFFRSWFLLHHTNIHFNFMFMFI